MIREEEGQRRAYLHLGTGNYHPGTALQYTDLGLLTSDPVLGRDAEAYMSSLARRGPPPQFKEFLVAPQTLYEGTMKLIHGEKRSTPPAARACASTSSCAASAASGRASRA